MISCLRLRLFAVTTVAAFSLFADSARAGEPATLAERRVRAHVTFLADDLLEGRDTGTRGHGLAMNYVAAQFMRLGLEPAGASGYQQPLALRQSRLDIDAGKFVIRRAGSPDVTLAPINDMIARPAAGIAASELTAPAVFVGFAIHAPEFNYSDFAAGIDVRGKIAVVLAGSPKSLPATAKAHYSREKTAELVRRGAIGIVSILTPAEEKRAPWAFTVNAARFASMRLINPDGSLHEAYPELRATASVSRAAAAALFKHASRQVDAVFAAAERSEPQAFALNVELTLGGRAAVSDITSANVLGWLPGTDPALAGEPIVVTAHLDHLGIGPPINGDSIYNGALDNALGTAALIDAAEQLVAGPRLQRPLLFAALTAEEKGLLGATHLVRHPPARVRRFAANLNFDMPVILAPTRDVIGIGAEHTSLGNSLAAVAAKLNFTVSPDPTPDEVVFVRSAQYPFIRAGVPALFMKAGQLGLDPKQDLAALEADFRKTHYHKPSDDLTRPIHWPSAGDFAVLTAEFIRAVADDPVAPAWKPGDFFGTRFGPEKDAAKR
jgi:Zn-dependent M28 family amino/carboxypeptidase